MDLEEPRPGDLAREGHDRRIESLAVADHDQSRETLRRRVDQIGLGQGRRQRLLDQDVDPGFQELPADLGVSLRGHRHARGLDPADQLPRIAHGFTFELRGDGSRPFQIQVRHRDQPGTGMSGPEAGVVPAQMAYPDDPDGNLALSGRHRARSCG